jgi:hypothetical protein
MARSSRSGCLRTFLGRSVHQGIRLGEEFWLFVLEVVAAPWLSPCHIQQPIQQACSSACTWGTTQAVRQWLLLERVERTFVLVVWAATAWQAVVACGRSAGDRVVLRSSQSAVVEALASVMTPDFWCRC